MRSSVKSKDRRKKVWRPEEEEEKEEEEEEKEEDELEEEEGGVCFDAVKVKSGWTVTSGLFNVTSRDFDTINVHLTELNCWFMDFKHSYLLCNVLKQEQSSPGWQEHCVFSDVSLYLNTLTVCNELKAQSSL